MRNEYAINSNTVSGNLVNLLNYHLKSIERFEYIVNKRIEMYGAGNCKNWFHWIATLFGKDYNLSESAKKLSEFQFEIINALKIEPRTLLGNFGTIENKMAILTRTYNEYNTLKTTYEKDINRENLSKDKRNEITTTYQDTVRFLISDFHEQTNRLYSCFNICDSDA